MNPQQLFTNPGYSPASTPVSSLSQQSTTPHTLTPMSTENSPASTESSSLTPSLSGMQLGKCRGHPRKIPKEPTYDDFTVHGTAEDKKWYHRKNTDHWRYNKLMSAESSEYHRAENEQSSRWYHDNKVRDKTVAKGLEGIHDLPKEDEPDRGRVQELSRQR